MDMRNGRKSCIFVKLRLKSKKDSKEQESIQSSTTPVPGYQMGKQQNHNKRIRYKRTCIMRATIKGQWKLATANCKNRAKCPVFVDSLHSFSPLSKQIWPAI